MSDVVQLLLVVSSLAVVLFTWMIHDLASRGPGEIEGKNLGAAWFSLLVLLWLSPWSLIYFVATDSICPGIAAGAAKVFYKPFDKWAAVINKKKGIVSFSNKELSITGNPTQDGSRGLSVVVP